MTEVDYTRLWAMQSALHNLLLETALIDAGADAFASNLDPLDLTAGEAGRGANAGAIRMISVKVADLEPHARLGLAVQTQELSADAYMGICQTCWDALVDIQKQSGVNAFRWAAVYSEVIVPTAVEFQNKVVDAAETAKDGFAPLMLALVVIVVAIAVIKVT